VKILHVIQRYPPAVGGSETWCREVSRYLRSVGDEVRVLTLDILEEEEYWRDPPLHHRTVRLGRIDWDDGVLIRRYRRSLPVHLLHHLFFGFVLDRALRIYCYGPHSVEMYGRLFSEVATADVVHLHTVPYPHNYIGYLAARLHQKRVVITPHFHPDHPHYERWSNYWLLKRCDAVIAVSNYERDYLVKKGLNPQKIVVTGNGVYPEAYAARDLTRFRAELFRRYRLPPSAKIILFVGRKLEYKGLATLTDAFRLVAREDDAVLLLAGPTSSWFEAFYGALSPEERERIIDLGAVSEQDKVNLLHLAHVLVLPSRFEAFGIVFLEAWACGTPVIGAATGAVPSVIGGGGLTFEYGQPQELAKQLRIVLNDTQRSEEMSAKGRRRLLDAFTWEKIGSATRETYFPVPAGGMRILICSSFFPPHYLGGAELIAYKQAKILKSIGHEVRVFCGRLGGTFRRSRRARDDKGEFHQTWVSRSAQDISGASWDFRDPDIAREFCQVLDDFSPHLVHFHNLVGLSLMMVEACHARDIPTVMTLHDYWGICFKNTMIKNNGSICQQGGLDCLGCREMLAGRLSLPSPVRNAHLLFALNKVSRFISPSHYLAERYAANGLPAEKIVEIKYGIDLESFAPAHQQNDGLTLGFIGHLGRHKGLDVLLHALSLSDCERIRLLVIGRGEEEAHLKALCRELGVDQCVTFYGHVDNHEIPAVYQKMDVLVVPSVWPENSPVTIAEAMASSLPVIASKVGGVAELVEDEVTGFLVPPRDSHALAERLGRFLAQPKLKKTMGEKALTSIQRYALRGQVEQVVGVYREVLDRRAPQPGIDYTVVLYDADVPWNLALHEMFHGLAAVEEKLARRLLICRVDLADEEILSAAKLLVIPTPGRQACTQAVQALQRQIPLLVPEAAGELKDLCLTANAGLFYANAAELLECLLLLLSDELLRQAMGSNGYQFIAGHLRASVAAKDFP
jgi:glycosyltransferase involved in cell wall biosynthesis